MNKIYLYDFALCDIFDNTDLLLFGYMQIDSNWRKVELLVNSFDITLNLSVDCNIFKASPTRSETSNMVETYLYNTQNKQNLRNLKPIYQELVGFLPFKGAQSVQNNQKIVEFKFKNFKEYETFQRKINNINESIIEKFKKTNDGSDSYIQGILYKELLFLHQFLINEQSQYTKEQLQYNVITDIIALFDKSPDKCTILLQAAHVIIRNDPKYKQQINEIDDFMDSLKQKCIYSPSLTKYPFVILENDTKNNYILKLLRHSKCQLAGFNTVKLNKDYVLPADPTDRIHLSCNSLQDIIFDPTFEPNTNPLTLLAWDIEVCTHSGKFDNDGTNELNKVLCIGMSFGLIQQGTSTKQKVGVCITWVDSADNQLTLSQFQYIYKQYLKDQQSDLLQLQYVIRSENESQMIKDFFSLINLFDPSFITGFNDFQFDFPFIKDKISTFVNKGIRNDIQELLQKGFMMNNGDPDQIQKYVSQNLFHSQSIKINASDNKAGISLSVRGIISIDTRILLMKTQKLEKKSLNDYLIANNLPVKLDVSFRDMNKAFKTLNQLETVQQQVNSVQTQDDQQQMDIDTAKRTLSDVFKYCMYDSEACCLLWQKRNILQQAIEVSKLSFTPLKYSFLNADGIKVRNMVAKFAFDRKFCVPMTNNSHDIRLRDIECLNKYEKYPGAYVSPPKKGISTTPVSALDFESLYPSIIMAHNLSPEKVIEPLEIIPYSTKTTQIAIPFEKGDMKEILEGNVLTRDSGVGIYPEILKYLFDSRKQVKKQMEHIAEQADQTNDPIVKKELEFQTTLLNCKQLAIKVFMNTFYGETGNQKSPLFDVLISGGTTTLGQKYIRQVHSFIEEQDCEIVYGDSIVGDEPLILRDSNKLIHIKTIESLMFNVEIGQYGMNKQQTSSNYDIWVYDKWVPIKRVIRHKVNKQIYRVITGNSMIEVTEDHSLINTQFQQVKPEDCEILETEILQGYPVQHISKQNKEIKYTNLQRAKLHIMGLLYNYKQEIPTRIINGSMQIQKLFLRGVLYNSTLNSNIPYDHNTAVVPCNSKLMAQQIYFLAFQVKYYPSIQITRTGSYIVQIHKKPVKYENIVLNIKNLRNVSYTYVYDIETDLGMFAAGIGQMTLKNTDSVYFRPRFSHFALYKQQKQLEQLQYNNIIQTSSGNMDQIDTSIDNKQITINSITYKEINDISADMLQSAYDATERLKVEINRRIGEQTGGFLKLAFEELLYPSMFTGKKKYCGVVYVPGKMTVKSKLTIKDILLRGIDFIKSQYPEIIKQVGYQTLISIMEHFMTNIRGFGIDQLEEIFKDSYRDNLNTQLKDLIRSQILNLNIRLINIKPDEYRLLASKKKLRSTKTGQMMLFRQRLVDIQDANESFIFNSLKEMVLQINISELQQSGIDVPEDGEILDLISIKPPTVMPKMKASELIHLLQYAQQKHLPINIQEYLKMYRTTASRILVSSFFNDTIVDPDEQEKQALKDAKKFCDECQLPQNTDISVDKQEINPRQLHLIGVLDKLVLQFNSLIYRCIQHVYTAHQSNQVNCDSDKLLTYIVNYLQVNGPLCYNIYTIGTADQIKLKLDFQAEQSHISGSCTQLDQYITYISNILNNYQESHLLLVITRVIVLIRHQSIMPVTVEQVKEFLMRIIYIQRWKLQQYELMTFINRYNKLPSEMSEMYNWLFKQKTIYIELSKLVQKKQLSIKSIETAVKDTYMPIPGFIDIYKTIDTLLIQKADIIKKFFEESIWDLEYQLFKGSPITYTKWANEQVDLYKKGIIKQANILKIMKVFPDITI